ncbi:sugar kinase [Vibrio sinaloensis]|uniref:sugar kinase n=1 Tax=Photobacterium sp. (strain ATCC 43367) TaxID=379097 RepID=UPI0022AE5E0C|nr:sugar kinase [Vibrio sinaloensis]MCZ4295330.1 sugar kinase [Vibrio sinaloensis]
MNPINRVAIIGECMVELKKQDGALQQGFGGDTLNTAVYLSRLTKQQGVETSYVTGLGHDPFSREMLSAWQDEGLNTDMVYLSQDKLPGIYAIETADDGERSFFYWRNDSAAKFWLRERALLSLVKDLCQYQMIYLSGISLAIIADDCRQTLIELLSMCRKEGVVIAFDNNFRPQLWSSVEQARDFYAQILSLTDMAFLTFDDEVLLWGDKHEDDAISRAKNFGVKEIIIKRGADDCFVVTAEQQHTIAAIKVDSVIDTTAAGDSFSAGYLAKRILGGDLAESALAGHKVAGTVIQHRGAIIPSQAMPII